jgi:hypothetical protein
MAVDIIMINKKNIRNLTKVTVAQSDSPGSGTVGTE